MTGTTCSNKSSIAAGIRPPTAMWAAVVVLLLATSGVECYKAPCKKGSGVFKVGRKKYKCKKCPIGSYSSKGYLCVACPRGKSTLTTGATKCLTKCKPGYGSTGGSCKVCLKGYYRSGVKLAPCKKCKSGSTTPGKKATACVCKPGYGVPLNSTSTACITCAKGFYAPGGSLTACTSCPNNGTTASTGSTSCL